MRGRHHDFRFEGILKMKLQASDASAPEGLQSQYLSRLENRLSVNGLAIVHRRLDIELAAHHAVIELVSKSESGTGIFNAETRRKNRVMCRKFVSRDRTSQRNWPALVG